MDYQTERARIIAEIQAIKEKIKQAHPQWWEGGKFVR